MQRVSLLSDEELVDLVRSKDREQYAEIVRRYETKLVRYAGYLISDHHLAQDAVQNSFIKAFMNLNGFNRKMKFSSWIYRIVHNEAINLKNKYRRETSLNPEWQIDSGVDVMDDLSKKEIIKNANDCMSQMPVKYSEPLALFFLEDKSYAEISDILRMPMGTVAIRINRAKAMMKKLCQTKV